MSDLQITPLRTLPQYIDRVVDWHYAQWNELHPGESRPQARARIISEEMGSPGAPLPQLFLALSDDEPVGTVGLVQNDLENRPDLHPWLASVYTDAYRRNEGIGKAMVRYAEEYARAQGYDHIYLFTPDAVSFYEQIGWRVFDRGEAGSKTVTIMRKDFAPKPSPVSVNLRARAEAKRQADVEQAERELASIASAETSGRARGRVAPIGISEDPFATGDAAPRKKHGRRGPTASRRQWILLAICTLLAIPAVWMLARAIPSLMPARTVKHTPSLGGPGSVSMEVDSGARSNAVVADAGLEAAVRKAIHIQGDRPIPPGLLDSIVDLDASNREVEDLTGIGSLRKLERLDLRGSLFSTLRPLLALKSLRHLDIRKNRLNCASQRLNIERLRKAGCEVLTDCP